MNLRGVQKNRRILVSVQYKKRKATLPNIASTAVVEICEVRYEYSDDSSPVMMEYFVNKNLDETHRDIFKHDIETNRDATKMVIEKFSDGHDDDEKKNHRKRGEIHIVITENVIDFSTCFGDRFYDTFDKEEEIITEVVTGL